MGCRALPCRVIAPDRAYSTSSNRLALVRLRRPSRGAMGKRSPQHRRSSAAIEDWPVPGCCASPGTARTWRTTLQASCSDSVRLGVQRHRQSRFQEVPGGVNRVQRRQRALNAHLNSLREAQALSQRPMDTSKQPFLQSVTRTGTSVTRSRTLVCPARDRVPARPREGALGAAQLAPPRREGRPRLQADLGGGGSRTIEVSRLY